MACESEKNVTANTGLARPLALFSCLNRCCLNLSRNQASKQVQNKNRSLAFVFDNTGGYGSKSGPASVIPFIYICMSFFFG